MRNFVHEISQILVLLVTVGVDNVGTPVTIPGAVGTNANKGVNFVVWYIGGQGSMG